MSLKNILKPSNGLNSYQLACESLDSNILNVDTINIDTVLKVDQINELTLNNGVNIEDVNIKRGHIEQTGIAADASLCPCNDSFFSGDVNQVFQRLAINHDNISLNLDSYYNSGDDQFKSSFNTSSYQIYKINDELRFNYGVATAGDTLVNYATSTAAHIDTSGIFNIDQGLVLPNGGSTLDHYQMVSQANTISGIWAAPQNFTITLDRIGSTVSIIYPQVIVAATVTGFLTVDTPIPADFRPPVNIKLPYCAIDNGVNVVGWVEIQTNGVISFHSTLLANFAGAGNSGVYSSSLRYSLD